MRSPKKVKKVSSFPWKAVFGAIMIIGVVVMLSSPNEQNLGKGKPSFGLSHTPK